MRTLHIADNLTLPLETVTQTIAILGIRGSGKTHTASVVAEELLDARQHVVIIDPLDAWWGLRSSADGTGMGLPITILGGAHGDIELEATAGGVIADVVVDERLSAVLSLRHLSKTAQRRFVAEFCERLYHRKGEDTHRLPLHVVIDEADAFVPQRVAGDTARVMGAVDDLVRRGRSSGFGVTLITQRPATIHKDVLTQAEILIAHRVIAPQDRKALESWIEAHDAEGRGPEFMASLASLEPGTAWFWSPGWLDLFEKIRVRKRTTFDSSATPKAGQAVVTPTAFAPVDLAALRERIAATVERITSDDPAVLRKRIAELERELAQRPRVIERVEVPGIDPTTKARITLQVSGLIGIVEQLQTILVEQTPGVDLPETPKPPLSIVRDEPGEPSAGARPRHVRPRSRDGDLKPGAWKMLQALAGVDPLRLTRRQMATIAGVSLKSSSWPVNMAALRDAGYIEEHGDYLAMTQVGRDALGWDAPPQPKTTAEMQSMWRSRLKPGAQRMFDVLIDAYPAWLTRELVSDRSNNSITSSSFSEHVKILRDNGLAEVSNGKLRAADTLFLGRAS